MIYSIYYIVPLPLLASATFGAAAAAANAYQDGRQTHILSAAAGFSFGHMLITVALMLPTNSAYSSPDQINLRKPLLRLTSPFITLILTSLIQARLKALYGQSTLSEAEEKESSALTKKWLGLHAFRVLSLTTSFVLGLKALAEHF